jgi:hypothetical protein
VLFAGGLLIPASLRTGRYAGAGDRTVPLCVFYALAVGRAMRVGLDVPEFRHVLVFLCHSLTRRALGMTPPTQEVDDI